MVAVAEVMGLVHALDFVQWHDAEVMVDADVVHEDHRVLTVAPLEAEAMVAIDLLDTVNDKRQEMINDCH